jgi:riboflavin kinase / FMN adenylyltransferase
MGLVLAITGGSTVNECFQHTMLLAELWHASQCTILPEVAPCVSSSGMRGIADVGGSLDRTGSDAHRRCGTIGASLERNLRASHVRYLLVEPATRAPAVLAVGDFDGVTASHLRLVSRAVALASARTVPPAVVVVWPSAEVESPALTSLDERLDMLAGSGYHRDLAVLPFADAVKPDVGELCGLLDAWYDVQGLVALADTRSVPEWNALRAESAARGWTLSGVEVRDDHTADIASLVVAGDVARAAVLLGHPYQVRGKVTLGDRRGRLLGFPTANLRPDPRKVLPANGVYAVRVRLPGEDTAIHAGVANIGVRPTFGEGQAPVIEVHLLDATLDLYGLPIAVELIARIRAERRFPDVEALKAQVAADAQHARALLNETMSASVGQQEMAR